MDSIASCHATSRATRPAWTALHVTQRGVNRCAIFLDDDDRHHYLRLLRQGAFDRSLAVHAYVLMSNHVHLLVTVTSPGELSRG